MRYDGQITVQEGMPQGSSTERVHDILPYSARMDLHELAVAAAY
jgi:hypothetical protein